MTYPPTGGPPDPYQQPQPYGQPGYDPYAAQASGAPMPYKQPEYGAPGYPPVGYPAYQAVPTTNTMAILSLVFAFIFSPLAIVFGHIAKKQIRETGEQGDGIALAGLIIGYLATGAYVLFCAFYVIVAVISVGSAAGSSY